MSRSVMFIDCWTGGKHVLLPIDEYLREKNIHGMLVHYGSWDDEPGRPQEEHIDGLHCRDISYYKTRLLYRVLKQEKPDCLVTLTTNNIIDRAKILAARALGIPSVFLMHGILATTGPAIDAQVEVLKPTMRRKRFSKIPKQLRYMIPNYFYSGFSENSRYLFTREPYRVILSTFRHPERWKFYPDPSPELHCDHALAWGNVYKDFLVNMYGYNRDAVVVTGHPPLDKACLMLKHPPPDEEIRGLKQQYGIDPSARVVLYIEGAFVYSGYQGWTRESLLEHLLEIAGLCAASGTHLVVKLHPSTKDVSWLKEGVQGQATLIQNADVEMLMWASECVIGHSSTLINSAIVLEKPVFIPRWGISQVIPANFDGIAPVVVCKEPGDLVRCVQDPEAVMAKLDSDRTDYLRDYLEPLDGKSQERISKFVADLASRSRDFSQTVN